MGDKFVKKDLDSFNSSNQAFDQFKGKKSTYNDDLYNTKIDHSKITSEMQKNAFEIESEIKKKEANRHMQNQVDDQGVDNLDEEISKQKEDEEMQFSSVIRTEEKQINKEEVQAKKR